MKRNIAIIFILLLAFMACKKSDLNLLNPNLPTPTASLATEDGLKQFALGIITRVLAVVPGEGVTNIMTTSMTNHSIMGDEAFSPYGNWGFRWVDQVHKVTLPNGNVVVNPFGVKQQVSLQSFNSRAAGELNAFQYEWAYNYYFIAQANTLLKALENPAVVYSGDADTKKATMKAWALWWKGYSYSRIGSIYLAGIINDDPGQGNTNNGFVTHEAIITEANRVFDECLATLNDIMQNASYDEVMTAIVASFNDNLNIVTPDMWKRQVNSYKARNLLVNKKVSAMTPADWNQVSTLADAGLVASDHHFKFGMTLDGVTDLSNGFHHPLALIGTFQEFTFVSERFIQEFKAGDARLNKNFYLNPSPYPANIRGRGLQFGTRWAVVNVEDGGTFATNNNQGFVPYACTYEENALMKAEALIRTGQINPGLQIVDQVRTFQSAGLAPVANTGLTQAQALEELRRERRVALFFRGVGFYDARRLGFTVPAANGGGRANAMVYLPATVLGTPTDEMRACFMDYDYMDYWDIPQNELDFNAPAAGSPPVKN
jgi:starch-binding outer membrane protein, SusD/RagB family